MVTYRQSGEWAVNLTPSKCWRPSIELTRPIKDIHAPDYRIVSQFDRCNISTTNKINDQLFFSPQTLFTLEDALLLHLADHGARAPLERNVVERLHVTGRCALRARPQLHLAGEQCRSHLGKASVRPVSYLIGTAIGRL